MNNDTQVLVPKQGLSLARAAPFLILVAGLAAFFALGLNRYLTLDVLKDNREVLSTWVLAHRIEAVIYFVIIYAFVVAFSLPIASLFTITGGLLFGTIFGTMWVVIGATIGATFTFLAAKAAIGDALRQRLGQRFKAMEDGLRTNAFSYLLVLRLVPLFPFWLVNLAPAFFGVRARTYVAATLIGIIPGSFVYASVGAGLNALFDAGQRPDFSIILQPQFILPIVGLAALALVPVVYRKLTSSKSKA
ncbi:MAG: TVP38/TMEM64 family protein [Micropepsaceae bacterium]